MPTTRSLAPGLHLACCIHTFGHVDLPLVLVVVKVVAVVTGGVLLLRARCRRTRTRGGSRTLCDRAFFALPGLARQVSLDLLEAIQMVVDQVE
eukprot:COSAG02_NODE_3646_length_6430_cov_5.383036_1_plen_93_part_00